MSEDDDSSKSEAPSEQKLRKAREKGDVPTTREPGHMASYLATLVVLTLVAPAELPRVAGSLALIFDEAPRAAIGSGLAGAADLRAALGGAMAGVLVFVLKVMAVYMAASLVAAALQGPFVVAAERIRPKFSKISPMSGAKRLMGPQNLVEFAKNLVKLTILVTMCAWLTWQALRVLLPGAVLLPETITAVMAGRAGTMLTWICAMMVPVAIADLAWKRFSYMKKQKMSQKEVRDEHKNNEGDPQIKARREQIRRARARARLSAAVPTATLVVTNPTHYAVALRYERGVDMAPVCVAKGADLVAARIRALAHEHEIPVIESVALARALHAAVEVDQPIPEAHWGAVAELVGFVYDLRKRRRRKPPQGAVLRHD